MEPVFLTLDEVLEIHKGQIELHGGSHGLRDAGALDSAVATPMATFGGEYLHSSITAMAAAYLFHIAQNHPFIDGNKRSGAKAALVFLEVNDWVSTFEEDRLEETVLGVASGVLQKPDLIALFEHNSRPVA